MIFENDEQKENYVILALQSGLHQVMLFL